MVQKLRLCAPNAGGIGLILDQETNILHATRSEVKWKLLSHVRLCAIPWHGLKINKNKNKKPITTTTKNAIKSKGGRKCKYLNKH